MKKENLSTTKKKRTFLQKLGRFANSWTGTIIIVLLFTMFIAQNFIIPSGSMIKTLLIGDMLFVKKFAYGIPTPHIPWLEIPLIPNTDGHIVNGNKPKRGEIVVFRYPKDTKIHYIKRCVAIGGDELFLSDKVLYLHPYQGDEYIKKNFDKKQIVSINNKLWVKNPYKIKHKGIWHENSRDYLKINAGTTIYKDSELLRIYNGNLYVHYFNNKEKNTKLAKTNKNIMDKGKLWIKTDKDYPLTASDLTLSAIYANRQLQYFEQDYFQPDFTYTFHSAYDPYKVPENEYFMMGDNRDNSSDSRVWGTVPYGLLEGTPWFIYFSINKDDYSIRWERVGRNIESLEGKINE